MDPERWNHVDKLLQSALDRPEAERDVFLRSACGGDEHLEREVRSLLAAHDHADGVLATRRSIWPPGSSPAGATAMPAGPAAIP
jgi:hypothetical protein